MCFSKEEENSDRCSLIAFANLAYQLKIPLPARMVEEKVHQGREECGAMAKRGREN
jgi:hypothetical protein